MLRRWENEFNDASDKSVYEAILQVFVKDEIGALADVTSALADMRVSILNISSKSLPGAGMAVINLTVGCKNVTHFQSIVSRLKSISSVESVTRGYTAT